ncbi:hypothetical protein [Roseovarius sp. MBR-6]|jgi:hypothetical protein|uniref:hypothetical protein n=1 Tax=Roseovarius sp. MBR-6 TaxID=3156459 RepID=UPI003396A2DA
MTDPIFIAKADADAKTPAFQQALKRANELGVDLVHVTSQMAVVPHAKRRDPRAYAQAKHAATILGTTVSFGDPEGDANNPPAKFTATHLDTEDALYILAGKTNPRDYQRMTTKARNEQRRIVPLRSWDDAPEQVRDALAADV